MSHGPSLGAAPEAAARAPEAAAAIPDDERRGWLVALALYVVGAIALTWPLATRLGSHLPLGTLGETTVPWFNLWTLEWNADRILHGYAGYWDAPLFYPARDGFALSEPQALTGLWFAPLAWLCGPVAGYNLTLLLTLVLNALAARLMLCSLDLRSSAAMLGGVLVLGLPFVHRELGVLQLTAVYPLLLGASEVGRLTSRSVEGGPAALLRLGLWLVAALWTCIYYALFLAVLLLLALPFALRRGLHWPKLLAAGAASLLLVLSLSWPIVSAQRRAVSGFQRSEGAIHAGSASALSYLQFPKGSPLARVLPGWTRPASRRSLYPGLALVALAAVGVGASLRSERRRFALYCALGLLVALFLSFGTRWQIGPFKPYESFVQHVMPGFAQLRSPYRAAVFVQLFLVVFAGWGLDRLSALRAATRWARWVPVVCVACALLEFWPRPRRLEAFPNAALHEPWIDWLAHQPAGAVAMVPPAPGTKARDYAGTVLAMLQALRHGHPIVNGYSGFFPAQTDRLVALLKHFPSPSCLRALRGIELRYVVVDAAWASEHQLQLEAAGVTGLQPVYAASGRAIYVLQAE